MNFIKKLISYTSKRLFLKDSISIFVSKNVTSSTTDARIEQVNKDNVADVLNFQPARYVEIFKQFLDQGDIGYYAYLNNKCVHRSWVKSNSQLVYPHWAYSLKLEVNQHFIHYCETALNARGQNIYPAVLSKIVKDLKGNGEVFMSINTENAASIKGAQKAGFVEKERISILIILGIKIIRIKTFKL